jgi:methanogen homocitrate synthase
MGDVRVTKEIHLWKVSGLNSHEDVIKQLAFSKQIKISDCTLRDGEQQAGIVFTKQDKIDIAKSLDLLGIHEIESGMPAVSTEDRDATEEIARLGLNARITALSRATKSDIDVVADTGVWGISISFPIGDLQRKYKFKHTDEEYVHTCLAMTEYAKNKGLHVILSPYDTTRARLEFLDTLLQALEKEKTVDRIRLVDTVGAAHPRSIQYLVNRMKLIYEDLPIEVHCHDDFGMATANTLAALEAGAEVASVTMNGIGERSGNCALEEVVVALKVLYGIDIGIQLERLKEVSGLVESLSGIPLQRHKPVVGENSFQHESGMIVAGLLQNSFVAEPYVPELVGQRRKIIVGKKSGAQSLKYKLLSLGFDPTDEQVLRCLVKVKSSALASRRALTDTEVINIYKDCRR